MRYKFNNLKGISSLVLILANLLVVTPALQAEPVVNEPAQPTNRLIDASQWLPDAPNQSRGGAKPDLDTVKIKDTLPSELEAANETRGTPVPIKDQSNNLSKVVGASATAGAAHPPGTTTKPVADASGQDIRDSFKEVVRPLYQDLATSDAAQALRGLQSELGLEKEQTFNDKEIRQTGSGVPSEATAWEGQSNREPPRTAAQAERDKILASVLMDKLIDEITPWAIGLVALYILGYLGKLALAYGKHRSARRQQRNVRRRRTKSSS